MMMSACLKPMHSCQNSTLVTESQPDLAVTPHTSVWQGTQAFSRQGMMYLCLALAVSEGGVCGCVLQQRSCGCVL